MPKRPPSHHLEQESITALEALLNRRNWLFEPFHNDYGIDGRIEMFQGEDATGKICFAQLKATNESDLDKALQLSISVETIAYWLGIDTPVCVIRFVAVNQTLYARWIRNFPEIWEVDDGQKSVTLHWDQSDALSVDMLTSFEQQFDLTIQLKAGRFPSSIPVALTFADDVPDAGKIQQAFMDACQSVESVYFVRRGEVVQFRVSRKNITTSYGAIMSTRWPTPTKDYPLSMMGFDLLGMLCELLLKANLHAHAARLALHLIERSSFLESAVPNAFVRTLLSAHLDQAQILQEADLRLERKDLDATQMLVAALVTVPLLRPEILDRMLDLHRAFVSLMRTEEEYRPMLGNALYNLSSHLRRMERYEEALVNLNLARSADPEYAERYSWWMERGFLEYQVRKFRDAQTSYMQAYRLVARVPLLAANAYEIQLFAAEAAFFGGRFTSVIDLIRAAALSCESVGERALMIQFAAEEIVKFGVQTQDAQVGPAIQVLNAPLKGPERFRQAIKLDALNSEVWELKLQLDVLDERWLDAAKAACVALVLSTEGEETAQAAALLLTHVSVRGHLPYELFMSALIASYQMHGLSFFQRAEEALLRQKATPALIAELHSLSDAISHAAREVQGLRRTVNTPWGITVLPWRSPSLLPLLPQFNAEIIFKR